MLAIEKNDAEVGTKVAIISKSTGCSQSNPIDPKFIELWFSKGDPTINRIDGDIIYVNDFAFLLKDLAKAG